VAIQRLKGVTSRNESASEYPRASKVDTARVSGPEPSGYVIGREPVMRISMSFMALCCRSGIVGTVWDALEN